MKVDLKSTLKSVKIGGTTTHSNTTETLELLKGESHNASEGDIDKKIENIKQALYIEGKTFKIRNMLKVLKKKC